MPKQEIDGEELFNLALSIVGLVLKNGPHNTSELAEHFGFSEQTIKKAVLTIANSEDVGNFKTHFYLDDELLEEGEVDFAVAESMLTEPPVLSKRQVTALAAGLDYIASLAQFANNPALKELRELVGDSTTSVVRKVTGSREAELMAQLQRALMEQVAIECEYVNQLGERSTRTIDPLRLDFVLEKHYLRGFCHKNQAVRSFRIDRIVNLRVTSDPISDESKSLEIPLEVFGTESAELSVKISAEPEAAQIFWNFPSYSQVSTKDGRLVGEISVGSLQALGRHITRYGGLVKVIEPPEAVRAVREFAQAALLPERAPENED
ncbi:MAG TPA: WYL domain-containing protein [Aquiluna sp.]